MKQEHGEIVIYQAEDGQTALEVQLTDETVWLSLNQLANLFGRDKSVVSRHLANIFQTGELPRMGKSIRSIISTWTPLSRSVTGFWHTGIAVEISNSHKFH